jgi:hypothetical protein
MKNLMPANEVINKLDWVQRQAVSIHLHRNDWKSAIECVPALYRDALFSLCEENSLSELADQFDPMAEGIRVDSADIRTEKGWHSKE